jgi:hypothetical protein
MVPARNVANDTSQRGSIRKQKGSVIKARGACGRRRDSRFLHKVKNRLIFSAE